MMNIEQENNPVKRDSESRGIESKAPTKSPTSAWKYLFLTILVATPSFFVYSCASHSMDAIDELKACFDTIFGSDAPEKTIIHDSAGLEMKEVSQIMLWRESFSQSQKWTDPSFFGDNVIELKVDFIAYYGVNVGELLKDAWYDYDTQEWELNPLPLKLLSLHIQHQDITGDKGSVSPSRTATEFNRIRYYLVPKLEKALKEDPRNKDYAKKRIRAIFKSLNLKVRFKTDEKLQQKLPLN